MTIRLTISLNKDIASKTPFTRFLAAALIYAASKLSQTAWIIKKIGRFGEGISHSKQHSSQQLSAASTISYTKL